MATNTLHIRVKSDGTRVVTKDIKGIGEAANLASRQIFLIRRAITTLFAAAGIRAGFRMVEQFTELNNKLKTVTSSTRELIEVRKKLLAISNDTRSSMGSIVQLYTRTTRAVKGLGLSEAKRLKFTSLLAKESVIGGATTIEADNAIRQLTQGMGAAGLKGEELRSVLEQLPTVAQRIADFLGVDQQALRKLGEEGKLTGEVVIAAMLAAEESIEQAFGETIATVGGSFEVFKNNVREFVGELDEAAGGSRTLAGALQLIGNNLKIISALLLAISGRLAFVFLANNAQSASAAIVKVVEVVSSLASKLFMVKAAATGVSGVSALLASKSATSPALDAFLAGKTLKMASNLSLVTNATLLFNAALSKIPLSLRAAGAAFMAFAATPWGMAALAVSSLAAVLVLNTDAGDSFLESLKEMTAGLFDFSDKAEIAIRKADKAFLGSPIFQEFQKKARPGFQLNAPAKPDPGVGLGDFSGIQRLMRKTPGEEELPTFEFDKSISTDKLKELRKEIARVTAAQEELNAAYVRGAGGEGGPQEYSDQMEQFTNTLKNLKSQEDADTGGVGKLTESLQLQTQAFGKAAVEAAQFQVQMRKTAEGEAFTIEELQQRLLLLSQGADPEAILKMIDAQRVLFRLTSEATAKKEAADKAKEESVRKQERETEAILRTVGALKEELRLFGLVGRERQKAEFLTLNPNKEQIEEFDKTQSLLGRKETEQFATDAVNSLTQAATRFAETSKTLRAAVAESPEKIQKEAEAIIKDGEFALLEASKQLGVVLGTEIGSASEPLIEQAKALFVTGAGEIGAAAGAALQQSFLGALAPGLAALGSQFPIKLGSPGGAPLAGQDQANQDQTNARLLELQSRLDEATRRSQALNDSIAQFGPNAGASFGQASGAAKGFGDQLTDIGKEMQTAFNSIFSSLEDALVGFVTTGKLDFKSLVNSILADLARMVVRMLIIRPLMGFFGGFFGGAFGFSGGGSVGGAFGLPGFAGGGFVNDSPAIPQRFATGGKVHGPGTGVSDSVNALLSRDEFVVNAAASRPNMAGLEYLNETGRMPGGGTVTSVSYAPSIQVTVEGNSSSAASDGARIAKDFEHQIRAQFNEFVAQEQRPGGAFSKTKDDVL